MGGKTTTIATSEPRIGAIRIQQSSYGLTCPVVYGANRIAGNLSWYGDFTTVAVTTTTTSGGKGGGGKVRQQSTTYRYYAAVMMGIGEGPIASIATVWRGKKRLDGAQMAQVPIAVSEVATIHANGKAKVSMFAYWTANTGVTLAASNDEGADTPLTAGTDYTVAGGVYQFATALAGRQVVIAYTWTPPLGMLSAEAAAGLTLFRGSRGQAPWDHLTTKHPEQADPYSDFAYVATPKYELTSAAEVENHNFEVNGRFQYPGRRDCDPADFVADILTHPAFGASFPGHRMGDLSTYSTFCRASGIFISPALTEQSEAHQVVTACAEMTNSAAIWSEGLLKFVPYGDSSISANGATYIPNLQAIYDLTDDDFLRAQGDDPVKCRRKTPADAFNATSIEFINRANDYNIEPMPAEDQANIEEFGLRTKDSIRAHWITDANVANYVAHLAVQRSLGIRNDYEFRLGWRFALLEPMDIVTVFDEALAPVKIPVRIVSIDENEFGDLTFIAEDFPVGVANVPLYPSQIGTGYVPNFEVDPGDVSAPTLFEPPVALTTTGLEVWAAVSGASPNWGGCTVWASLDGDSYRRIGVIDGGSRYGLLSSTLAAGPGGSAAVALAGQGGQMLSGSATDADNLQTLCYAGGEFFAYETATLTAANAYTLTGLRRGAYGSPSGAKAAGSSFVRVDQAIAKSDPLALDFIGKTIQFKFTSFNVYGGAEQGLADVDPYAYTVTGDMVRLPPTNVAGLAASLEGYGVRLNWAPNTEPDLADYEIRVGGADWDAATFIARSNSSAYLWAIQAAGNYTIRVKARDKLGNYSTTAATTTFTITAPSVASPSISIIGPDVRLQWAAAAGSFAIDRYRIKRGSSWAGGVELAQPLSTAFVERVTYGGAATYWIAAIDVAGNEGAPVSIAITITNPSAVTITPEVIDNNVLLRWTDPTASLPIARYQIRRGSVYAAATVIGEESNARFTALFEQVGGTFVYWVTGYDTAGNAGTPAQVSALVNQPPDYVLRSNFDSTFSGTKSGLAFDGASLFAPIVSETYQAHFTTNAWGSPNDQIVAGYPRYFQPSAASAYYEETIDYGSELPATGIAVTLSSQTITGAVTITPTISVKKLAGDAWTDYPGQTQVVVSAFRYVKVRFDFSATGGDDLLQLNGLNVKLSTKLRNDAGTGTANASDIGGTTVSFGYEFIDVTSISVTPSGTAARYAIYDFADVPNPTSFKVLLFDSSGARVSGPFSWSARGF